GWVRISIPRGTHSRVFAHSQSHPDPESGWLSSAATGHPAPGRRLLGLRSLPEERPALDLYRTPDWLRSRNRDRRRRLASDQRGIPRRRPPLTPDPRLQHSYLRLICDGLSPHLRVTMHHSAA